MNRIYVPFELGEVVELSVLSRTPKGEGIARFEEFTVFVKDTKEGRYRARITGIKRTYAIAEAIKRI